MHLSQKNGSRGAFFLISSFLKGLTYSAMGRDCIERNSIESFNCSVSCEGIYADVQWVEKKTEEEIEEEAVERESEGMVYEELKKLRKRLADLERNAKGEELDKEKYKMLIGEYRKFKAKIVKHFRFNSEADSSAFGKS